jgi:outer membrane PBP1 activator LpoA protein
MARERSELEKRRDELSRSLPGLSKNRAETYRRNSDALALDRAGVKHERPQEMVRLGEDEAAADAAIRGVQRELRDIESEIELMPRRRLGARVGSAFHRAWADR